MKTTALSTLSFLSLSSALALPQQKRQDGGVQGFDISHYQGTVDFDGAYNSGARFVIIKATEGTSTTDPDFSSHYEGATNAGLIRGGYHFAHPDESSGADQANFFLDNGGGWTGDGQTLPGMLDIEYNPNGATCYGLSTDDMVNWISDFVNTYYNSQGVSPLIYTTNSWWDQCTANSDAFSSSSPLVLARYASSPGTIPGDWGYQTIWQNADSYTYGGDSDIFNGSEDDLQNLATNG